MLEVTEEGMLEVMREEALDSQVLALLGDWEGWRLPFVDMRTLRRLGPR